MWYAVVQSSPAGVCCSWEKPRRLKGSLAADVAGHRFSPYRPLPAAPAPAPAVEDDDDDDASLCVGGCGADIEPA